MSTTGGKQISNPFSTGGGGVTFETQVQASFCALMLAGGFAPCLPCRPIQKLILQGKVQGYSTDDLIVFTSLPDGSELRKLLVQIKHSISLTEGNQTFGEVVEAAWLDFQETRLFSRDRDAFALVTGPLSATDIEDSRTILEWARHSTTADEFFTKVETANFSSDAKRQKLKAFRVHVDAAAKRTVSQEELFQFLRHFHLLGYDLDVRSGVMHAMLHSVIARHAPASAASVWAQVVQETAYANQNAGTLTRSSFSVDLQAAFAPSTSESIPASIASAVPPSVARAWDSPEFGSALVVANLLGGWNENSAADMAIVADLTEGDPVAWLKTMREVLQLPNAPLTQQSGVWTVRNRQQVWQSVAARVFDKHLKMLQSAAAKALAERHPQFELDPNDRFAAAIYGKVPEHSMALRRGIAETLALLGNQAQPLRNISPGAATTTAIVAVRQALADNDWKLWASLNDLLPTLAEAAPDEFMDAVERALSTDPSPFVELFAQEGNGIGGTNYMTGLLWALETVAWDEQHIVRAAVLLGSLAARDPGGSWGNRPANSLTAIFLPWLPQTTASSHKRQVAIRTLCTEHPSVGWRLLLSLMPDQTSTSMGTRKPRWRASPPADGAPRPSTKEYWEQVVSYAELALQMAANDVQHLKSLAACLDRLPPPVFPKLLEMVTSEAITSLPEETRFDLWASLAALARKHRRFADAEWSLPEQQIETIESAIAKIAPKRADVVHRVLFTDDDWNLYEENDNWEEQERQLALRRREAVAEVHAAQGVVGVIAFAERVDSPGKVGFALGSLNITVSDDQILPRLLRAESQAQRKFAEGFVRGCFYRLQWSWVDALKMNSWTHDEIAQLFLWLPFCPECWSRVESSLGEHKDLYWRRVLVNPYQCGDQLDAAADVLLAHGRPRAALECVAHGLRDKKTVDLKRAIDVLLAGVSSSEPIHSLHAHHLVTVIQALQENPATPSEALLQVEWAYLPLLNEHHGATPKLLETTIASDPQFFCELVRKVYRSKKAQADVDKPTPDQEALAKHAYHLLHDWRTVPGTGVSATAFASAFTDWINAVKTSLDDSGHTEVGLHQAGAVLIHSPADPNGLWIHRAIAGALNRDDMAELRRGYSLGIYNSRGVHSVDPTGEPEKKLAAEYMKRAEDVENAGFHRLAVTLREVAATYEREAEEIIAAHAREEADENDE